MHSLVVAFLFFVIPKSGSFWFTLYRNREIAHIDAAVKDISIFLLTACRNCLFQLKLLDQYLLNAWQFEQLLLEIWWTVICC